MQCCLLKKINRILKSCIIVFVIMILETKTSNIVLDAHNSNLNKQVDLKQVAILDMSELEKLKSEQAQVSEEVVPEMVNEEQVKEETPAPEEENPVNVDFVPITSLSGRLTGYVYNCPKCGGTLACDNSIDLTNGTISYNDATYGNVRIVASSKNLPCGSIVSINASKVSDTPIVAIVLDRGVTGNKLDLLMPSEEEARSQIGNTPITYDVLRNGY